MFSWGRARSHVSVFVFLHQDSETAFTSAVSIWCIICSFDDMEERIYVYVYNFGSEQVLSNWL